MRLIWSVEPKKKETDLDKAIRERLARIEQQCTLLDKLTNKVLRVR